METLGGEMCRVQDRQWNLERFIVFQMVILQRARHVTASHAIQWQIGKWMGAWEAERHGMLVEGTLRTCTQYLTAARREESKEHRAQNFRSLVLRGKLRTEVWWITERKTGGGYFNLQRGAQIQGRG